MYTEVRTVLPISSNFQATRAAIASLLGWCTTRGIRRIYSSTCRPLHLLTKVCRQNLSSYWTFLPKSAEAASLCTFLPESAELIEPLDFFAGVSRSCRPLHLLARVSRTHRASGPFCRSQQKLPASAPYCQSQQNSTTPGYRPRHGSESNVKHSPAIHASHNSIITVRKRHLSIKPPNVAFVLMRALGKGSICTSDIHTYLHDVQVWTSRKGCPGSRTPSRSCKCVGCVP
jgi:hypothetical protein